MKKNDVNFIEALFADAKQKWFPTPGDPERRSVGDYSSFSIPYTFETTP